jgi:multiple sugar transport system permease protein
VESGTKAPTVNSQVDTSATIPSPETIAAQPALRARAASDRRPGRLSRSEATAAFLFLLPNTICFLLIGIFPVLASFSLSFFDWPVLQAPDFVGLENYRRLLFEDTIFVTALLNTLYFVGLVVPLNTVLALGLAMLLNIGLSGTLVFRAIFFFPVLCSSVATSLIWKWMYNTDYGLINYLLRNAGLPAPDWLASLAWAMPALIIMAAWQGAGFNMVILLAGLQNIPRQLYEAAEIDGAGALRKFRHVTLPMLSPTLFFVVVIAVIHSFQVFDQAFVMTEGGPGKATTTIVYYLYQHGFKWFQMGYASAIAWVLFVVLFGLTLAQVSLQTRWVHYE